MHPADEFLMHYGVAGMKWGKRKVRTADEQAERRAKTIKVLKVAGAVTVAAAVAAGAIYAGKQMNSRAGERAIRDFDNSELRDIMQSGQLFARKVVSESANVKIPKAPKAPKESKELFKKAAAKVGEKVKPKAQEAAAAALPHIQRAVVQKIMARAAQNKTKVKDLDDEKIDENAIREMREVMERYRL